MLQINERAIRIRIDQDHNDDVHRVEMRKKWSVAARRTLSVVFGLLRISIAGQK